jgi:cyclopropane fatty-acyl-phospholipid synthase-like methyltransferase
MHAFDLTPAMLERFREVLARRGIQDIGVAQADVLELHGLPPSWGSYDLVVSASMLEYLPRARLGTALHALRSLLKEAGTFVLFITRRNWLTRPLIGRWWQSNLYGKSELDRPWGRLASRRLRFTTSRRGSDISGSGVTSSRRAA